MAGVVSEINSEGFSDARCGDLNESDVSLYVEEAYAGKSIVLKRFRARAKGRASGIKKPYSNLTIILSENRNNKKEELHGSKG